LETSKSGRTRTARIHPAIGIARLGNSKAEPDKDGCFIGPEVPGVYQFPEGGYRDAEGRLKRQGARFRVFGYDEMDRPVGEILENDAVIEWRVHLRNTKAVGRKFNGLLHPDLEQRNSAWLKAGNDEKGLILDPGLHEVSKVNPDRRLLCKDFMGATFDPVLELGRLIYEKDTGRLIVLGGQGRAGTPDESAFSLNGDFANHDSWFDDTSDGVVTASVTFDNGRKIYVKPAWVVVGPPKFAPELQTIVTLYDTLYQVAIDRALIANPFSDPRFLPSFSRDVYPILRRADEMRWVFAKSDIAHTFSIGPGSPDERQHIFRQFRVPSGHPKQPGTGTGRMPYVWSDLYLDFAVNGTVTLHQYRILESWAAGNFHDDWDGKPPALSFDVTSSGLDRAALEACVGAAFFPGIEVSWKIRDVFGFTEPFRLDAESLSPGDISQQMSLPWQTDFVDCAYEDPYVWWPAQRPINVRESAETDYSLWARGFSSGQGEMGANAMVEDFYRLGHVLRSGNGFFEAGRVEDEPELPFNESNFRSQRNEDKSRKS